MRPLFNINIVQAVALPYSGSAVASSLLGLSAPLSSRELNNK